ncbi:hypothetical protein, partial [Klebsiella michiganensis]
GRGAGGAATRAAPLSAPGDGERKLIQPGFPGGGALRLSGLPARRRRWTRSPGKRSATREEAAPM